MSTAVQTKVCSKCVDKTPKLLSAFAPHPKGKYGRAAACIECENKRKKQYKKDHPERVKQSYKNSFQLYQERRLQDPDFDEAERKRKNRNSRRHAPAAKCHRYGLTYAQRQAMEEAQHGVCAICHKPETTKNQWGLMSLAIDHDHKTGAVRGLLCNKCNVKLKILEDESYMVPALAYLKKYS